MYCVHIYELLIGDPASKHKQQKQHQQNRYIHEIKYETGIVETQPTAMFFCIMDKVLIMHTLGLSPRFTSLSFHRSSRSRRRSH